MMEKTREKETKKESEKEGECDAWSNRKIKKNTVSKEDRDNTHLNIH